MEAIRKIGLKYALKAKSRKGVDFFSPYFYRYAQEHILCECPACSCPHRGKLKYSFTYIDETKKLIYFDVPKSASSSIRRAFFGNDHRVSMSDPQYALEDYYTFTVVRNPWSRMVSNWKMFTKQPFRIKQLQSMTDEDLTEFEDFVAFAERIENHHWQPQSLYVPQAIDFIAKMESLEDDLAQMAMGYGAALPAVGHLNKTTHSHYTDYYTENLAERVGEMHAEDV